MDTVLTFLADTNSDNSHIHFHISILDKECRTPPAIIHALCVHVSCEHPHPVALGQKKCLLLLAFIQAAKFCNNDRASLSGDSVPSFLLFGMSMDAFLLSNTLLPTAKTSLLEEEVTVLSL